MRLSTTGNERFYLEAVNVEAEAQAAHSALFSTHAEAYHRYFDMAFDFGEPYVRENFPEISKSVDLIHASLGHLQELRSSTTRRDRLIQSLVAEMKEMAERTSGDSDPVIRLRSDLKELSTFRVERLDGIEVDFWTVNATGQVSFLDKKGFSGPAIVAWCEARAIKPKMLADALLTVAPLLDQYPSQATQVIAMVSEALDCYSFDADTLLECARSWPEANRELVEGVIASRNLNATMSFGR